MKNFFVRAVSGLLYAAVLVAGSIWFPALLYVSLAAFVFFGLIELKKLFRTDISDLMMTTWGAFMALFLLFVVFILDESILEWARFDLAIPIVMVSSLVILLFISVMSVVIAKKPVQGLLSYYSVSFVYLLIPFIASVILQNIVFSASVPWLMVVLAAIWINDTMAYITGSLFGKHKLVAHISPGKTIEGVIGGLLFTVAAFITLNELFFVYDRLVLMVISIIIVACGTLGDLVESKLKREAEVKDSGNFLPGHGGLLDRIDSLLVAAPFACILILFIQLL